MFCSPVFSPFISSRSFNISSTSLGHLPDFWCWSFRHRMLAAALEITATDVIFPSLRSEFYLRSKMPTAADQQHSKSSSKPKNTICKYTFPEAAVATSNSGERPQGQASGSDHQSKAADDDQKAKKAKKYVRFGPAYGEDTVANKDAKEKAWNHLGNDKSPYLKSIKDIEKVMECYDASIVEELKQKRSEFRKMIARDGCFFLQLSLHILGGWEHLGYPETNPYFGKKIDSAFRIPDMFFVGNQIPYIVIESLMAQPFFQKVIKDGIKNGTWRRPKDGDLAKLALYQTVVEPQLEKKMTMKTKMKKKIMFHQPPPKNPPSDVLEALRNLHLGTAPYNDPTYSEMKKFHDLEAGTDGTDVAIPGAGELYKQGIKLVKGQPGITNIRFENWGYCAYLYVPQFAVDAHTEVLLTSLANRELHLNESERELTSYLRFMRDLARTYKDFKILQKKGIIRVEEEEEELKGNMVHMLDAIVSRHNCNYTLNFRQIRRKIKDYGGPPWRLISFCLGLLTVVQTIFTVLSYCFPPRS